MSYLVNKNFATFATFFHAFSTESFTLSNFISVDANMLTGMVFHPLSDAVEKAKKSCCFNYFQLIFIKLQEVGQYGTLHMGQNARHYFSINSKTEHGSRYYVIKCIFCPNLTALRQVGRKL